MRKYSIGLGLVMALALSACGGNDDDNTSSSGTLSGYAGTWKDDCSISPEVKNTAGDAMREQGTFVFTANGNNLTIKLTTKIYQPTDTACTGTAVATHVSNGSATFKSNTAFKLNGADVTGQTVSISMAAIGGGLSSGGTISLNGVVYPGDYFTQSVNIASDYWYLKDNQVYSGDSTTLESSAWLTKVQ